MVSLPTERKPGSLAALVLLVLMGGLLPVTAAASDHWDSASARGDQAADLTDVYAFPLRSSRSEGPRLVLSLSVHPYASAPSKLNLVDGKVTQPPPESLLGGLQRAEVREAGTQFSDVVDYVFRIRPADLKGRGPSTRFVTDPRQEIRIVCRFDNAIEQAMTCRVRDREGIVDDLTTRVKVDDESGGTSRYIKAFAGVRADPSFIEGRRVREPHPRNAPKQFEGPAVSPIGFANVLSIVLDLDADAVLRRRRDDTLFAVVGETLRGDQRVDRMGRVFMNSFLIGKLGDVLNAPKLLDLVKDRWNQDDAFDLDPTYVEIYKETLQDGLTFVDSLETSEDGKSVVDWPAPHPLLDLFVNDFLVVDLAFPTTPSSAENTFLEIELANFRDVEHRTCGGRKFNDDMVDPWFTLLINGPGRRTPIRGDGIDRPTRPASDKFPYLSRPFLGTDRAQQR